MPDTPTIADAKNRNFRRAPKRSVSCRYFGLGEFITICKLLLGIYCAVVFSHTKSIHALYCQEFS